MLKFAYLLKIITRGLKLLVSYKTRHRLRQCSSRFTEYNRSRIIIKNWKKNGSPIPPPHLVKQEAIREYQKRFRCDEFVETGTYLGEMVTAQLKNFKKIFTIELSEELYNNALIKFRKNENVEIFKGDSGKLLPDVLAMLKSRSIFWLDGHYSAGITARGEKASPIYEELEAIFNNNKYKHVILIDDARCFNGENDYPTILELENYIKRRNPSYCFEIKDDIIRLYKI